MNPHTKFEIFGNFLNQPRPLDQGLVALQNTIIVHLTCYIQLERKQPARAADLGLQRLHGSRLPFCVFDIWIRNTNNLSWTINYLHGRLPALQVPAPQQHHRVGIAGHQQRTHNRQAQALQQIL